jgi:hypothetical protein
MPVIAITRLHVRSDEFATAFWEATMNCAAQAEEAAGHLGAEYALDDDGGAWTKSMWQDPGAMRAFMISGAHHTVMPLLREWCDEAMVTHWEQDLAELPSWPESHAKLTTSPKVTRVTHPSARQSARSFDDIPAPIPAP